MEIQGIVATLEIIRPSKEQKILYMGIDNAVQEHCGIWLSQKEVEELIRELSDWLDMVMSGSLKKGVI